MGVHHLPDLVLVFVLNHLDQSLLVRLEFVLVDVAAALELLEGHFELFLALDEVTFVLLFLTFEELTFSFPESLVAVVG